MRRVWRKVLAGEAVMRSPKWRFATRRRNVTRGMKKRRRVVIPAGPIGNKSQIPRLHQSHVGPGSSTAKSYKNSCL